MLAIKKNENDSSIIGFEDESIVFYSNDVDNTLSN